MCSASKDVAPGCLYEDSVTAYIYHIMFNSHETKG